MTKWVVLQLHKKFTHKCCENIDEFNLEQYALTKTGQHKEKERHEKTTNKFGQKFYTIGFSNEKKIAILKIEIEKLCNEKKTIDEKLKKAFVMLYKRKQRMADIYKIDDDN